jgi:hypothetical protein
MAGKREFRHLGDTEHGAVGVEDHGVWFVRDVLELEGFLVKLACGGWILSGDKTDDFGFV